jgi:hypothetical protein
MSSVGRVVPVEEDVAALRAVTVDDVGRIAVEILGGPRSVAVVGPLDGSLESTLARLGVSAAG